MPPLVWLHGMAPRSQHHHPCLTRVSVGTKSSWIKIISPISVNPPFNSVSLLSFSDMWHRIGISSLRWVFLMHHHCHLLEIFLQCYPRFVLMVLKLVYYSNLFYWSIWDYSILFILHPRVCSKTVIGTYMGLCGGGSASDLSILSQTNNPMAQLHYQFTQFGSR